MQNDTIARNMAKRAEIQALKAETKQFEKAYIEKEKLSLKR